MRLDVKYAADAAIADSKRAFQMSKAGFDEEVNTKVCLHRLLCHRPLEKLS